MVKASTLIFSIIVPLEYHRGQWEQCIHQWCEAQRFPREQYEVIAVAPRNFSKESLAKLAAMLSSHDRLELADASDDISLYPIGAAASRGDFLIFTESHCWPDADVLQKCSEVIKLNAGWSAFSCHTTRVANNRLSEVAADMYEHDIQYGMLDHPWRKVLEQCFVTRRDCYLRSGGFETELGYYAEWALSAKYFSLGYTIGYAPDVKFHHHYMETLKEVRHFTRDFSDGEMRYFSGRSFGAEGPLLDVPPEWACRGNFNRALAWCLLRIAVGRFATFRSDRSALAQLRNAPWTVLRWLFAAIGGVEFQWMRARTKHGYRKLIVIGLCRFGSQSKLRQAFKAYVASIIHERRLAALAGLNSDATQQPSGVSKDWAGQWDMMTSARNLCAGLSQIESLGGVKFRWSEPLAVVAGWMPSGRQVVRIECLPNARLHEPASPQFYFNEVPIPRSLVTFCENAFVLTIVVSKSGIGRLAWACPRIPARRDASRLGLPITGIRWL